MLRESTLEVPKRRAYSAQLKAQVLLQCSQEGASVSGVALSHSLNANMVHRWIREERQRVLVEAAEASGQQFVPLQLQDGTVIEAETGTTPTPSEAVSVRPIHLDRKQSHAARLLPSAKRRFSMRHSDESHVEANGGRHRFCFEGIRKGPRATVPASFRWRLRRAMVASWWNLQIRRGSASDSVERGSGRNGTITDGDL